MHQHVIAWRAALSRLDIDLSVCAGVYRVYAAPAEMLARADELGVRDLGTPPWIPFGDHRRAAWVAHGRGL